MYPQDESANAITPRRFRKSFPAGSSAFTPTGLLGIFLERSCSIRLWDRTTCAVAKSMGRRYIGIDVNAHYIALAQQRVRDAPECGPLLLVGRAKYPGKEKLQQVLEKHAGTAGRLAEAKHKRRTYGRRLHPKLAGRLTLV